MAEQSVKIEYQYFYTTKEWMTPDGEHKHQKEPRVTVCYLRTEDCTAVGMAICGPRDNPCRKIGKKIAKQRAQHALGLATNSERFCRGSVVRCSWIGREDAWDTIKMSDICLVNDWNDLGGDLIQYDTKIRCVGDPNYRMKRLTA